MHKENTKSNRISVSGSLGAYCRKSEVFIKTAPNTFGLLEKDYATTSAGNEGSPVPERMIRVISRP